MSKGNENRKFYEEKVPICQPGQRPEDMWRIHELETEIAKIQSCDNDETESEQQSYRDGDNIPTEMAVLRREYISMRSKLEESRKTYSDAQKRWSMKILEAANIELTLKSDLETKENEIVAIEKNTDYLADRCRELEAKLEAAEKENEFILSAAEESKDKLVNAIANHWKRVNKEIKDERDQLQAANGELRKLLQEILDGTNNCDKVMTDKGSAYEMYINITYIKDVKQAISTTPPAAYARLKALEEVETLGNKLIRSVTYNSTGVFVPEKHFNDFVDALQRLEEVGK